MIKDVKQENTFWLQGGIAIKNVAELARELARMNQATYSHHANAEKNDFANWVEHCVADKQLAQTLRKTKSHKESASAVEKRIRELTVKHSEQAKPMMKKPKIDAKTMKNSVKTKSAELRTKTEANPKKIKIIQTPHKTELKLGITEEKHRNTTLMIGHLVLGAVIGVAIAAIILTLT